MTIRHLTPTPERVAIVRCTVGLGAITPAALAIREDGSLAAARARLAALERLEARGLIERTQSGYRASELGMRFLNDVLVEFMPETPQMPGGFTLSI